MCWWFGQNNYCPGLWKVAKSIKKSPSLVTLWRQPIISKMSISLFPTNSPINSLTCFKGKRHRGLQDHLWSLTAESDQPRVTVKNKFWRNKTVVGAKFLPTPPRSAVRIQPSANFLLNIYTFNCNEKTKIKKKEAGNGPFIKIESFGLENTPKQAARDTRWKYCTLICCKIVVNVRSDTLL